MTASSETLKAHIASVGSQAPNTESCLTSDAILCKIFQKVIELSVCGAGCPVLAMWTFKVYDKTFENYGFLCIASLSVNHNDQVPGLTKVKTSVLNAAMGELEYFATLNTMRADETTLILTGDFGLTWQACSATVQNFNVKGSWRDWQMKATFHELPGDLIFVKNCVTSDHDVDVGCSWEYNYGERTELHDVVGAGVKMRLPFAVLNEKTAPQREQELRAELKALLKAEKAENAERLPKKRKTAAADGSQPVAQQSIAPRKPPVKTAAATGPQTVAQEKIASGGIPVDLSESEDTTVAVEDHAEGVHCTTKLCSGSGFVDQDAPH